MGALTNKPMAFNSRNWEYNTQLTNDITDFLTPKIRVDQFNGKIYRILPTVEWISNRIRFLYLGLRNQRITTPMTTYVMVFEINLINSKLLVEKKVLLSTNHETAFNLLKTRLLLKKKKAVNIIHGAVFDADVSIFKNFETASTIVNNYCETAEKFNVTKFFDFGAEKPIILYAVNPRMESPLLNLRLKEISNSTEIFSLGNFSFSFSTKVLSNNSRFFFYVKSGMLTESLLIFGLSSAKFASNFNETEKITLIPLYLLTNALTNNYKQISNEVEYEKEDLNLALLTQNVLQSRFGFNVVISTHFENNNTANLTIPVNGYLETSFSYYDKQFNLVKLNGLKPSFGVNDLLLAFSLFNNCKGEVNKLGQFIKLNYKKKVDNVLLNNNISNYLIRDSLGRANPLFKIS